MRSLISVLAGLFLSLWASVSVAMEQDVNWDDLIPEQQVYEDPFAELTLDQISDLANLLRLETDLGQSDAPDKDAQSRITELRSRLEEQDIDADEMFEQRLVVIEQRRKAAMEPNAGIVGKNVRIPGYVLPLELVSGKATEFLLVPTVGACIHTPPPPGNQIIHVKFSDGIEISQLYTPVWVSGELETEITSKSLYLVDGNTTIDVTYKIQASDVVLY